MIEEYLDVITSEHREQPKYMAMLSVYLEKLQHVVNILNAWNEHFHLEDAVGNQLDAGNVSEYFPGPDIGVDRQSGYDHAGYRCGPG